MASADFPACDKTGRPLLFPVLAGLALLGLVSVFAACLFGPARVPALTAVRILAGALSGETSGIDPALVAIVRDIRLPRCALSWLVGAALGLSGGVYQGLLRNPLADPFTLGVSTGAAFGASLAIFLGLSSIPWLTALGLDPTPLAALAGAMAALAAVIALAGDGAAASGAPRRETLVLAGIVTATFLSALISLIKSLGEDSVASIVYWLMGGFAGRGFGHLAVFLPYFLAGLAIVARYSRELDILALGETQARMLGVNAARVRLYLLIGASLLAAASVAVAGVIGFVGLIVPHLVRLTLGSEHRPLLAASALLGGVLLVWSDVLARTILPHGAELPAGVVTALLGGPFFCLLLRARALGRS
ncbi:MAG: iron ABC transporter permease [Desulfovibrionaceae bacterium]|nr:iron ABC transporter permease [Desulfovibrionaceae bacterium]